MKRLLILSGIIIALCACKKDEDDSNEPVDYAARDKEIIKDYISTHGLIADATPEGVYYMIENPGGSEHPTLTSKVKVHYKGYLTDGTVFDQTTGTAIEIKLNTVIKGWKIGIPLFGKGGKGKLFIPSDLAYGATPKENIPAHSVLIFDIFLSDFY